MRGSLSAWLGGVLSVGLGTACSFGADREGRLKQDAAVETDSAIASDAGMENPPSCRNCDAHDELLDGAVEADAADTGLDGSLEPFDGGRDAESEPDASSDTQCDTPDDGVVECDDRPCRNGATCLPDEKAGFICSCAADFEGAHCEDVVCVEGAVRCNPSTKNAEVCEWDGSWFQIDICNGEQEICRPLRGCESNWAYPIGNYDTPGLEPFSARADRAYLVALKPEAEVRPQYLAFYGQISGGHCDLVLYADDGCGRPGVLLGVGETQAAVTNGAGSAVVTPNDILMRKGNTYWMGAWCHPEVGATVSLLQRGHPSLRYYEVDMTNKRNFENAPNGILHKGASPSFFVYALDVP